MSQSFLWQPTQEAVHDSAMVAFMHAMNTKHGLTMNSYLDLWEWSVTELNTFWTDIWEYFEIFGQPPTGPMLQGNLPQAQWAQGATLNYAQNILRHAATMPDEHAIVGLDEHLNRTVMTWRELEAQVAAFAHYLRSNGIQPGDVVAGAIPNIPQAIVALLGTAAVGAIWSVVNVDFGVTGIVTRFEQLQPKVFLTIDGIHLGGTLRDQLPDFDRLLQHLPSVTHHVAISNTGLHDEAAFQKISTTHDVASTMFDDIVSQSHQPEYRQLDFSHPLWVLYSSGTTGTPKGIVHSHGGTVLEIAKSFGLHYRVATSQAVFISTSTTWMLWNMLVGFLLTGAKAVTYSGGVFAGSPGRQLEIIEQEHVVFYGCGAAVLTTMQESGIEPQTHYDLSRLQDILVSASPLPARTWHWIYDAVAPHVRLRSDSGGTDVCSVFVGSNPMDPVHVGELMGPALGVAADVYNEQGQPVINEVGELVITKPMPSMPLYFWDDPHGERYRDAYFQHHPHIWYHGDFASQSCDKRFVIHGRSDATLNRGGIRMGSSDIYQVVDAVEGVAGSMVVGAELDNGGYYMPLFVAVSNPEIDEEDLKAAIIQAIRTELSPRYVPDDIIFAPGVPMTKTGKLMEVPIKRVLQGMAPGKVSAETAADQDVLQWYLDYASTFDHQQ